MKFITPRLRLAMAVSLDKGVRFSRKDTQEMYNLIQSLEAIKIEAEYAREQLSLIADDDPKESQ